MIVVSVGCPSGIGPEVAVAAAAKLGKTRVLLVGDRALLLEAAERVGVARRRLVAPGQRGIEVMSPGPALSAAERRPGRPSRAGGRAQLDWIEVGHALAKRYRGALVTGPVSKEAIARSGAPGAAGFVGHTEYLRELDGAASAVMCFVATDGAGKPRLSTSLVTTHVRLAQVPRSLDAEGVRDAVVALGRLLAALGKRAPKLVVCSLNPHAGEGELFGDEERLAILPGIASARRALGKKARIDGPIGAETAYRKAHAGVWDGVVAMYHDQATIPMKLVAFGDAVNVTMGLSIARTSVDHGTGYDIAGRGVADPSGMLAAMRLGERLGGGRKRAFEVLR